VWRVGLTVNASLSLSLSSHCHDVTHCSVSRSLSCPIHHSILAPHLFIPDYPPLQAPRDGVVKRVPFKEGEFVGEGKMLIEFHEEEKDE
jgi:hypothetical protein